MASETTNLMRTLYQWGLRPHASSRELSGVLDLKPSRITTIRRQLVEQQRARVHYFPDLRSAGIRLRWGRFRNQQTLSEREEVLRRLYPRDQIYWSVSDEDRWFTLGSVGRVDVPESLFDVRMFHLCGAEPGFSRWFDYSSLVASRLGLEAPPITTVPSRPLRTPLDENQRLVERMLIEYPLDSDFRRSKDLAISHPTFGKIRRDLEENRLFKWIEPDLDYLELDLLVFATIELPEAAELPDLLAEIPQIFLCLSGKDGLFLGMAWKDIIDARQGRSRLDQWLRDQGSSRDALDWAEFPTGDPMLRMMLNTEDALNYHHLPTRARQNQDGALQRSHEKETVNVLGQVRNALGRTIAELHQLEEELHNQIPDRLRPGLGDRWREQEGDSWLLS